MPAHFQAQSLTMMDEEIDRVLRDGLDEARPRPRPVPNPPPASSNGPPEAGTWGLPNMRISTPLELLAEVADNTIRLQNALEGLVTKITGETAPVRRIRTVPKKGTGLLPAISQLAHEIDAAHAELARLIAHVDRQI